MAVSNHAAIHWNFKHSLGASTTTNPYGLYSLLRKGEIMYSRAFVKSIMTVMSFLRNRNLKNFLNDDVGEIFRFSSVQNIDYMRDSWRLMQALKNVAHDE